MIFEFSQTPHRRRHGPSGYRAYQSYKDWLRDEFTFRCVFCLVRERWFQSGHSVFSVEHLIPQSSGKKVLDYENLLYACLSCNSLKRDLWPIPDPCADAFGMHLRVNDDGTVDALSRRGSILLDTFRLNDPQRVEYRSRMLGIFRDLQSRIGNREVATLFKMSFGFPSDLPDLRKLRAPRNGRPKGVSECYYVLRERGQLPDVY